LSQHKSNLLIVVPTLNFGGAERDIVYLAPRLDRERFNVCVATLYESGPLAEQLVQHGIEIVALGRTDVPDDHSAETITRGHDGRGLKALLRRAPVAWLLHKFGSYVYYLRQARIISRLIRQREIDIVHAVLPVSYIVAGVAVFLTPRTALVMSRVSSNWYHQSSWHQSFLERRIMHRLVTAVIGNSRQIIDELDAEGLPRERLFLIHNGIDVDDFRSQMVERSEARRELGLQDDALVITVVANLFAYKGHVTLLKALTMIRANLPIGWRLLVIGRDVDGRSDRLHDMAERLGLASNVMFIGESSDVPMFLSAADLHVSASQTEGMPNNVLEAMAAGLPVIATSVGGVPELVEDGRTGLLVPSGDPQRLADSISGLAADPEKRGLMSKAAVSRCRELFAVGQHVAAVEEVYLGVSQRSQDDKFSVSGTSWGSIGNAD
jgi:glycosyltransferase involved in cell wall biosynthesis